MPRFYRKPRLLMVLAIIAIMLLAISIQVLASDNTQTADSPTITKHNGFEKVFSLAVGPGENEIGIEHTPQSVAWGPSGFTIGSDGVFYIVDGVNSRILVVNRDGTTKSCIRLDKSIVSPVDIQVVNNHLFLLDLPSEPPKVYEMDMDGKILRSWEIPKKYIDESISGFNVDQDRKGGISIDLELAMTWSMPFVEKNNTIDKTNLPKVIIGNHAEIPKNRAATFALKTPRSKFKFLAEKDWGKQDTGNMSVYDSNNNEHSKITLKADKILSMLRFVDCDKQGNVFIYTEETNKKTEDTLRAFLKKVSLSGRQIGAVEVPVGDFYTYPDHGIIICECGYAFIMVPDKEKVTFYRSQVDEDYVAAASAPTQISAVSRFRGFTISSINKMINGLEKFSQTVCSAFSPQAAYATWTKTNANNRAWEYIYNSWYCTIEDYNRDCGDVRPRYITGYNRQWYSTPYCWGGFHLKSEFNYYMQNNYLDAGDIETSGYHKKSCTSGVDCSGFVSRLWGLSTKRGTCGLDDSDIATPVSKSSMAEGDIYDKCGSHVVYFRYYSGSGASAIFEATKANRYDRCINIVRNNSYFNSYSAYRYRFWN